MLPLVLASASPRRASLLRQVGVDFEVVPSLVPEEAPDLPPEQRVEALALAKARRVAALYPRRLVLGADTLVEVDGRVLGKPAGEGEAAAMLRLLSGRGHRVHTGLALVRGERAETACQTTRVFFRSLAEEEISAYVQSGEPLDKAGGYGIQGLGALLVESIEGDYFNVVGLPLNCLAGLLADFGVSLLGRKPGRR